MQGELGKQEHDEEMEEVRARHKAAMASKDEEIAKALSRHKEQLAEMVLQHSEATTSMEAAAKGGMQQLAACKDRDMSALFKRCLASVCLGMPHRCIGMSLPLRMPPVPLP